ncbi:MAG: amidase [Ancalomicrobiaceae bacterium]|nr:amidase [Ancalomicrobiaceae bacterium]
MLTSLTAVSAALSTGETTAERLLDQSLQRIAERDGALNSFVHIDHDGARTAARDSDRRRAARMSLSPIDGVPISVKDSLLVSGMPATWGSRALARHVPDHDELPVARLRAAGAVLIGKTNVPELTLEGYTRNDLFGVTRNPWDERLTPGGSSGGAAAGVAAGFVTAAIGTDGGGSIRRPASHTGLVGWKPSIGHIPRRDGFPAILTDFEVIGTLTPTVADAALLDAVLSGPETGERWSQHSAPAADVSRPARILFIPRFGTAPVDSQVAAVTRDFATRLEQLGHRVETGEVFFDLDRFARIWQVISRSGVAWLMESGGWDLRGLAGASVQAMAADGARMTGADYFAALDWVATLRRQVDGLFSRYDYVLTPTAAALPWAAETPYPTEIDGQPAGPRDHAIFTGWVNAAGLPAISSPVGASAGGLPIGVQLVAGFGRDLQLLQFAQAQIAP